MQLPDEITIAQAAAEASKSVATIQRAIKAGQIKTEKRGRHVNVVRSSLRAWLLSRNELPEAAKCRT